MAGKKKAKKVGAKKAAAKKATPKRAAGAKKATPKRAAGAKKATPKKAGGVRRSMGKPPARAAAKGGKGELVELIEKGEEFDKKTPAERLSKEWERCWAKIVARTWTDPEFKHQLLESPARVLAAEGLPLLHDVDIRIVQGEGRFTMEIPLPDRPGDLDGELIDDLLEDFLLDKFKPKKCVMSSCCC